MDFDKIENIFTFIRMDPFDNPNINDFCFTIHGHKNPVWFSKRILATRCTMFDTMLSEGKWKTGGSESCIPEDVCTSIDVVKAVLSSMESPAGTLSNIRTDDTLLQAYKLSQYWGYNGGIDNCRYLMTCCTDPPSSQIADALAMHSDVKTLTKLLHRIQILSTDDQKIFIDSIRNSDALRQYSLLQLSVIKSQDSDLREHCHVMKKINDELNSDYSTFGIFHSDRINVRKIMSLIRPKLLVHI
jgi:hypothetical protein